jgi:hypothetical protein
MNSTPSSSTPGRTESHKKQQVVALPVSGLQPSKPKTPKSKLHSPKRDESPKAVGRSARKLEDALNNARLAYEKEQQVMKQLQQEHQTQLHDLLKQRLEYEGELRAHEDVKADTLATATSSHSFVPHAALEASPDKSKRNGHVRIHLSPPSAHSPFMAVTEHFDRQQSIYDAQTSITKTLFHSPLATSLLSSVRSRLDNTWLTKPEGAAASGVGKLAAHAREWCFPLDNLQGNIAAVTLAALNAAHGVASEAAFDSIFSAPALTICLQSAGLFKSHRLVASRGLLEVALAAATDETEQCRPHCVIASSEWRGGVAVTVTAYTQPCKFPAYALKFAAKLRCVTFPRIEPFIGVVINNEQDCLPVASISVSEGVTLTEYLFKERHTLSPRDMIDLATDVASAVACVDALGVSVYGSALMLPQVRSQQRPQRWSSQLRHLQRGCFLSLQYVPCPNNACLVFSRSSKQRSRWAALHSLARCIHVLATPNLSTQVPVAPFACACIRQALKLLISQS